MARVGTSGLARQRQLEIYAGMTGGDKIMLAIEMAEQSKTIAIDGIRARRPELSDAEAHQVWLRMLHDELVERFPASRRQR